MKQAVFNKTAFIPVEIDMSVLTVSNVTHGFGARQILDDASFRLLKGEHVGLIGANGEGKSTFLNIITGKIPPDEGKIEWIGDDTGTDAGYTGGTIPATIWRDFMGQVVSRMGSGNFDIPPSIRNEIGRSQAETEKENKDKKDKSKEKDNKKDSSEDKNKKESLADKAKNSAEKVGKTLLDKVAGQSVEE